MSDGKSDGEIKPILKEAVSKLKEHRLKTDWKGDYFSSKQLADLRAVYEKNGYETAKIFIQGKISSKGNKWENQKNEIILCILERLHAADSLDMGTKSYIIGKLNAILQNFEKEEKGR